MRLHHALCVSLLTVAVVACQADDEAPGGGGADTGSSSGAAEDAPATGASSSSSGGATTPTKAGECAIETAPGCWKTVHTTLAGGEDPRCNAWSDGEPDYELLTEEKLVQGAKVVPYPVDTNPSCTDTGTDGCFVKYECDWGDSMNETTMDYRDQQHVSVLLRINYDDGVVCMRQSHFDLVDASFCDE